MHACRLETFNPLEDRLILFKIIFLQFLLMSYHVMVHCLAWYFKKIEFILLI